MKRLDKVKNNRYANTHMQALAVCSVDLFHAIYYSL
jgi:hypothetical protein